MQLLIDTLNFFKSLRFYNHLDKTGLIYSITCLLAFVVTLYVL